MEIKFKDTETHFGLLDYGQCFWDNGAYYMKTRGAENAVDLSSGDVYTYRDEDTVVPMTIWAQIK